MANLFNSIRVRPPKSNRFNLSHDVKLTAKFGKITPILCQDCLPGDIFKLNSEVMCRFAPMVAPIMTQVNVYTHFFFVPKRLLWDNFKTFITGGEDGVDVPLYPRLRLVHASPQTKSGNLFYSGSLADYLGFPVFSHDSNGDPWIHPDNHLDLDALPFRAYQLIWNEYYRDQNLMDEVDIMKDVDGISVVSHSGKPALGLMQLRNRSWKKDYFTSSLPWAQRGDEVELPLQGTADLSYKDVSEVRIPLADQPNALGQSYMPNNHPFIQDDSLEIKDGRFHAKTANVDLNVGFAPSGSSGALWPLRIGLTPEHLKSLIAGVDLSAASSATINELRRAIKAQEFLELAARGGSRYIEQIYAYFGVRSSDARLQRPEFLGGGKSPVVISDILQTSQTTETSAQATPSGHAMSVQRSHSFKFRCEEHGYIIGVMSIMPKAAYMQGLPRMYQKFDRLDHYWPQFAHLGEQEIKTNEIYCNPSLPPSEDKGDTTFGYTPRYAEYKYMMDSIHGDFRDSLSFWHMGRIFSGAPALNEAFLTNVEDAANRVFNVVDEDVDKIWINVHHNLKALRKMPKYGTPLF